MSWFKQKPTTVGGERRRRYVDTTYKGVAIRLKLEKGRNLERISYSTVSQVFYYYSTVSQVFYYEIIWSTSRFKNLKFRVAASRPLIDVTTGKMGNDGALRKEARDEVFSKLRLSLAYAMNPKAQKMMKAISESNNQPLPHQIIRSSRSLT